MSRLPNTFGLGFKAALFEAFLEMRPPIGFFEVHAENHLGAGGPAHARLARLRADYALSIHGAGLLIGSTRPLDETHLSCVAELCRRYEPQSLSEHLAWSSHEVENGESVYLDSLLPLPYTDATLAAVCAHIDRVQEALGRRMLLENPATYLHFEASTRSETDSLREVVRRTGCGLLLDIANVFVSSTNHGTSAEDYLATFPLDAVGEIHLAGHAQESIDGTLFLIDTHGAPVPDPVWALYERVIARLGPVATLIEWDNDVPEFPVLAAEAARADAFLRRHAHARPA